MSADYRQVIYSNPFVRARAKVGTVMFDVVLSLLPILVFAYLAAGTRALQILAVSVIAALVSEFVFSWFFLRKTNSLKDGSALVTALLLACTLSPLTPWYVVAFGASMAVLFGKILWGGLGRNLFNPALVGREMMTVFFPAVMSSGTLWAFQDYVQVEDIRFFRTIGESTSGEYWDSLLFKTTGAIGEYSILFIVLGGLFLLLRKRISWHIPFGVFVVFFLFLRLLDISPEHYSIAGLLFGTIFMATDMPSSPSTSSGKLYYGMVLGAVAAILVWQQVRFEYMSYAILIMNGFSREISSVFKPVVWGEKSDWKKITGQALLLTLAIATITLAVLQLHNLKAIPYAVYVYIIYTIIKFKFPIKNSLIKKQSV